MSKILITGHPGQDAKLMHQLLCNDHEVVLFNEDIRNKKLIYSYLNLCKPDFIFNFAAISDPKACNDVKKVLETNTFSVASWLEGIHSRCPKCRFFSAGSSLELSGDPSLYAASKRIASQICEEYRRVHGLYVVHGILFNHISPYANPNLGLMKLIFGAKDIAEKVKAGKYNYDPLIISNGKLKDITDARDTVRMIWELMQYSTPVVKNTEIGAGKLYSEWDIVKVVFDYYGLEMDRYYRDPKTYIRYELYKEEHVKNEQRLAFKTAHVQGPEIEFEEMIRGILEGGINKTRS